MRRRKRGDVAYGGQKLVDIVLSILVVVSILLVAVAFWKSLHGVDKKARNEFRLVADLMQSVIDEPGATHRDQFFDLTPLARFEGRKKYKGVFFAISQMEVNGVLRVSFSDPQPPVGAAGGASVISGKVTSLGLEMAASQKMGCNALDQICLMDFWEEHCTVNEKGKDVLLPCLCFSRALPELPLGQVDEAATQIIDGVSECRVIRPPDGDQQSSLFISMPVNNDYNTAVQAVENSRQQGAQKKELIFRISKDPARPCPADVCLTGSWLAQ